MGAEIGPLVSVVVPTIGFNEHLAVALRSLLRQSHKPVEILLVLDGFEESHLPDWILQSPITVIPLSVRQGTPNALNKGIERAQGKYIARLDADDLAAPERFEIQARFLDDHPEIACVATDVALIDEHGARIGAITTPVSAGSIRSTLLTRNCLVHSSVMYRASSVREVGGYAAESIRMQDYELFLRMNQRFEFASIPQTLTSYRVHAGQHSRNTKPWARYSTAILGRRMELARIVGVSSLVQGGRNAIWLCGQYARHFGVVRPGYLRRNRGGIGN